MKSCGSDREQWNNAAESWVEFIRSGKNYYSEYLNGPALKQMMGRVEGLKVLDIGCGEGHFSRFFARAGAKVTAIDFSEALIQAALAEESRDPLGITYVATDAANLQMLESKSFDVAYCYMALMDIQDYLGAIAEVARVVKPKGRFLIVFAHPCFSLWRVLEGKQVGGWRTRTRRNGTKKYLYCWTSNYLQSHSYPFEWKHDRLPSTFTTTGYHRPLSDYVKALTKHGFVITYLDEPQPAEEGVKVHPPMAKHYRVPQSITIEATKLTW
ncbi:MAG: class I SAM-dependent methyltransferase [Promethearchaeota archaeon]